MKTKLIMVGLMVVLALSLLACSSPANKVAKGFSYNEFAEDKNLTWKISGVKVGDTVEATLASNPTTGFEWELAGISDQTVVKQDGETEFAPPAETIPGAGGAEIWTFRLLNKGTSHISLEYSRPWEGGEKAEWTLDIEVAVE